MTRVPTGYFPWTFSHGLGDFCFSPSAIFSRSLSNVQDHHLDFVVDLEHIAGVVDSPPAHVGDVQEPVDAAQVDERAEVGDVLDGPLADLADGDLFEQFLLLLFALDLDELPPAHDDVAPAFVDLEDHAFDVLIDVVGDVGGAADIDLAGRQEDVHPDIDQEPALDLAGDTALDDVSFVVAGDHHLPGAHAVGFLAGEHDLARLVLHAFEQNLDVCPATGAGSSSHSFKGTSPSDL